MRKRDRLKLDKALARAPLPGQCPKAPPRRVLALLNNTWDRFDKLTAAVHQASIDIDKAERRAEEADAKFSKEFLLNEDLMMRVAYLEKKLRGLGHSAD